MNFKREVILSENIIERENGRMYYFIVVKSYKKLFTFMAESKYIHFLSCAYNHLSFAHHQYWVL